MLNLIKENYKTFQNTANDIPERHWPRLLLAIIFSLLLSIFSRGDLSASFAMMVTSITVLTGFTFTALFSDHAFVNSGLPAAKSESDRHDLARLDKLSSNFQSRVNYFISLSIIEIVFLVLFSFNLSWPAWLKVPLNNLIEYICTDTIVAIFCMGQQVFDWLLIFAIAVLIFAYLECLYTFYRLSESIIAIVRTRREYMAAVED